MFQIGLGTLNMLKVLLVAGFVTTTEFGVWGILSLALAMLIVLKQVGVSDKYVQQEEADQETAFQKAFTLELLSSGVLFVLAVAAVPLLALAYGQPELLLSGLVITLVIPALSLQSPVWVFYRRMDFLRQRILLAADPVIAFLVTVVLALAGFGYWSLVVGFVAGAWAGAAVAIVASPYRLALRYDRRTMRDYVSFSWPVVIASASGLLIAQLSVFFGDLTLGLAGAGAITLAANFSIYADKVDRVISQTLYPAICAVRDRRDLLRESFTKSNRLALMWGVPFGVGVALFGGDLITYGIGEQWAPALVLIQVFGLTAAVNHIGFNWSFYYRAIGDTRPMAKVTLLALGVFLIAAVPLLIEYGLEGFAAGIGIMTLASLAARWFFIRRLFPGFGVVGHMLRAIAPTVPAVGTVIVVRAVIESPRTLELALGELLTYLAVTALATVAFERPLLQEVIGYLRRAPRGELGTA